MFMPIFENRRKFNQLVQNLRNNGKLNEGNLRKVYARRRGHNIIYLVIFLTSIFLIFSSPLKIVECVSFHEVDECISTTTNIMLVLEILCGLGFLLLLLHNIKKHASFELLLTEVMTFGFHGTGHVISAGFVGTGVTRYFCEYEFID